MALLKTHAEVIDCTSEFNMFRRLIIDCIETKLNRHHEWCFPDCEKLIVAKCLFPF